MDDEPKLFRARRKISIHPAFNDSSRNRVERLCSQRRTRRAFRQAITICLHRHPFHHELTDSRGEHAFRGRQARPAPVSSPGRRLHARDGMEPA
ncbi:hypothetical protein BGLA2_1260015 [Burkholderia gladioli]|nr:hypothetical protein BGLA2_1260015 [Burkholderia gladioli]